MPDIIYKENQKSSENWLKGTIGNFGKWQCCLSILLALLKIPLAWIQMNIVFMAPPTQFWCKPPLQYQNKSIEEWINISRPTNKSYYHDGLNQGYCHMKSLEDPDKLVSCVNGVEYNRTVFHSTIITEWDLICGKERLIDVSQIILMTGILLGNIIFGIYADKYGRKRTITINIIISTMMGFVAAWTPWFWGFVFARFMMAVANGALLVVSFVMCVEIVDGKWRTVVPILFQIPFAFGYSVMSVIAYFIRDWRNYQLAMSTISLIYLSYIWIIPESPRWLFVKGRQEEGLNLLRSASKFNGIEPANWKISPELLIGQKSTVKKSSPTDLYRSPVLFKRTVLICLIWLFFGINFFTFSQYIGHVGQDIFLTTALGGLISIPGIVFCFYLIKNFGRKPTIEVFSFLTALCFFGILAFPKGSYRLDWPRMACAGVGLLGISVYTPAVYLFTGELYPTTVRNAGMGFASTFARIGSMVAPIIIALHDVSPSLPLLILGLVALTQVFLVSLLPETKGKPLPDVTADVEK